MSQKSFEIRFDQARTRMNRSLKELEKAISDKLQSRITPNSHGENSLHSKVNEQFSTIQNLNEEINKLQQNLADLGKENDLLIEENANLTLNFNKFHSQGSTLIQAIESDLVRIEEIITGEKNG